MLIECARCEIRGVGCADCLVTVLYDTSEPVAGLGVAEQRAVEVFTRAGFDVTVLPADVAVLPASAPPTPSQPVRAA